jgi:hypothetical protein
MICHGIPEAEICLLIKYPENLPVIFAAVDA